MLGRLRNFRLSATLLGVSVIMLTAWFQAQLMHAATVEDGSNLRHAIVVIDDPDVRGALVDFASFVAGLPGMPAEVAALPTAIAAVPTFTGPVGDVLVDTVLDVRDQLVVQLGFTEPEQFQSVTIEMLPLLSAFEIDIPASALEEAGMGGMLEYPVLGPSEVARVAAFARWLDFANSWGLVIGIAAGILGFALAPKPLRTLGVLFALVSAIAFTAPVLFSGLQSLLSAGSLGAWGVLLGPLYAAVSAQAQPWLLPVAIGAAIAAVICIVADLVLARRSARESIPT